MSGLTKYSGLTTKVRAMRGQLLKSYDFKQLLELSTISEYVEELKKRKSFVDIFEDVNPENIHRGNLEKMFMYGIYRDFSKLYKFANIEQRKFLKLYFIKYEVTMLKRAIRGLNYKDSQSYYDKAEVVFTEYSKIDVDSVYSAQSIDEIVDVLKGTIYYEALDQVRQYDESTVFDYEMALDMFFFRYVWKKRKNFDAKEMKIITDCIGSEIDTLNIMWIYRAKRFYKMDNVSVIKLIIPIYHKISKECVAKLAEVTEASEFKGILRQTAYSKYLDDYNFAGESLDKTYYKILDRLYGKFFRLNPYSVACINTYLYDKSEEMSKLITVAECIRYGYKPEDIAEKIG